MKYLSSRIVFSIYLVVVISVFCSLMTYIPIAMRPYPVMPAQAKYVALTFDDGPYGRPTEQILDILKEKNVPATFFVIGKNVEKYPQILKREFKEGHIIGNHSYDHAHMGKYSAIEIRTNLTKSEQIILQTIGVSPALFRAPYGMTSPVMLKELNSEGFIYVGWNEDPRDWDFPDDQSDKILSYILKQVRPNGVIILHDGRDTRVNYPRGNTVIALPQIIDHLKNRGYTFVTIDKLMHVSAYKNSKVLY